MKFHMAIKDELKLFDDKFEQISNLYNDLRKKVNSNYDILQAEIAPEEPGIDTSNEPESSDDGEVKSKSLVFEDLWTSVNKLIVSLVTTKNKFELPSDESSPVAKEKESLERDQTNLTEMGQGAASLEPKVREEEVAQASNLEKTGSEDESDLTQKETSVAPERKEESATESNRDLIENPQNAIPRGVVVDPKHELIYVADWNCRCIRVYDYECNYKRYMEMTVGISAWGLALSNEKLYITDNRNDKVLYVSLETESNLREEYLEGPFNSPRGIAVNSKEQVFVADCNNNRIVVFDKGKRSHLETHVLKRPVDVEIVEMDLYIMCLCVKGGKRELYILKHTIWTLNYDEIISEKDINAFFFCIHGNSIYLSDMLKHSIKKYDFKKEPRETILSRKGHEKGQLFYPSGISVSKHSQIVIGSSNRGNRIQKLMPHS